MTPYCGARAARFVEFEKITFLVTTKRYIKTYNERKLKKPTGLN